MEGGISCGFFFGGGGGEGSDRHPVKLASWSVGCFMILGKGER